MRGGAAVVIVLVVEAVVLGVLIVAVVLVGRSWWSEHSAQLSRSSCGCSMFTLMIYRYRSSYGSLTLFLASSRLPRPSHIFVGGLVDAPPSSLLFDGAGTLWAPNAICINVLIGGIIWGRVGKREGLPINNLTSIAFDDEAGRVWVGGGEGIDKIDDSSG